MFTQNLFSYISPSRKYFRYISIYTDIKPLKCTYDNCEARFAVSTDLSTHVRKMHTHETSYQCTNCGLLFASSSEKSSHKRVHATVKKFKCECGKSFVRSSILKAHMRTHTGERPFICQVCSNTFTQLSSLKKHQRRIHSK